MITINILQINPSTGMLNVSVGTSVGNTISSVNLWSENTFKDYTKSIPLNAKLLGVNNLEVFSVDPKELGLEKFNGIYFLEFTTTDVETAACSECSGNMLLGVVADLGDYQECLLDSVLDIQYDTSDVVNNNQLADVFNIKVTLDAICTSIRFGYYQEAIDMIKILKKLCKDKTTCCGCSNLATPIFRSGLGFGILDNDLILSNKPLNPIEPPVEPCTTVIVNINGIAEGTAPLNVFNAGTIDLYHQFSPNVYVTPVLYDPEQYIVDVFDNTTVSGRDVYKNDDGTFTILIYPGFIGLTIFTFTKCLI